MRLRALRDACLGGFLYGALLYGAVLSLVHVVHNHLGSARDALIAYPASCLLYGLWSAAFFAWRASRRSRSRGRRRQGRRGLWLGLLAFNLFFWEIFFLYGLTYDQAPFHPTAKWGMAGVLALLARPHRPRRRRSAPGCCSGSSRPSAAAGSGGRPGRSWRSGSRSMPRRRSTPEAGSRPRSPGAAAAIPVADTGLKVILVGFDGADWRVIRPMMGRASCPPSPDRPRGDGRPPGVDPRLELGRHLGLDLYRDDARSGTASSTSTASRFPGMASKGIYPVHRTYLQGAVRPRGAAGAGEPDPGRPLLSRLAPLLGDRRPGRGSRPASWTATSTPSRRSRPSTPGELVPLLRARRDGGAPLRRRWRCSPSRVSLFREMRPFLKGGDFQWQSAALLKLLAERPQPSFVNFYTHQPDSDQHWFWKWYEPERFFGVKAKDWRRRGPSSPGSTATSTASSPACSPRPGRTPS